MLIKLRNPEYCYGMSGMLDDWKNFACKYLSESFGLLRVITRNHE